MVYNMMNENHIGAVRDFDFFVMFCTLNIPSTIHENQDTHDYLKEKKSSESRFAQVRRALRWTRPPLRSASALPPVPNQYIFTIVFSEYSNDPPKDDRILLSTTHRRAEPRLSAAPALRAP